MPRVAVTINCALNTFLQLRNLDFVGKCHVLPVRAYPLPSS
jgi:hypothetical protein